MKVVQVLPELNAGGVERGVLDLGRFLAARGHDSRVISAGGKQVAQLESEGSTHVTLPVHRKSLLSLRMVSVLRAWMRRERPDVVHVRSRVPAWLVYLAWRGLVPGQRPRLVSTVHGFYSVNAYSAVMTRGEAVVCVSQEVHAYVLKNYPRCPPERLVVIHRGVDPLAMPHGHRAPADSAAQKIRDGHPGRYLLTIPGRLTSWKGQSEFLDLVRRLKNRDLPVHGLIAGGAHSRRQDFLLSLQRKSSALGLDDDVSFLGDRSDLRDVLAVSDAVVSLSQTPEAFGRVTLEALSLGVPTLGYAHGGVKEQLEALYPAGAIRPLDLTHAEEVISDWCATGAPPVPVGVGPFSLEAMCEKILSVYERLTADASAAGAGD